MKTMSENVIVKNEELISGIYEMCIISPTIAKEAQPGQFVNVYTGRGEMLLPRPISICEVDCKSNCIRLLYQVVGKGTKAFSKFAVGESVTLLGPLGNGFTLPKIRQTNVLIGGGIGVPPLLELAKHLQGETHVFIGARSKPILEEEFFNIGAKVYVATDDGSVGFHGNAVELLRKQELNGVGGIFACGPKPMLKAVAAWAKEIAVDPQLSMEERMACGIGACVGCTTKIRNVGGDGWSNLKICKDGPVFLGSEVVFGD